MTTTPMTPPPDGLPAPIPPAQVSVGLQAQVPPAGAIPVPAEVAPLAPEPPLGELLAAAPRPRRRRRWIARTVVTIGVLAMAGLSGYLVVVAGQWKDQVDALKDISADLGQQVADANASRDAALTERDTMASQLEAAQSRITDLANEEANAKDVQIAMVDFADAFQFCSDQRQAIVTVLKGGYVFEGKTARQVETETTQYCDQLAADYAAYKSEMGLD